MTQLRERDIPFEGTTIHCWEGGQGFPLVMLHGSGAGASTYGNFKRVLGPLSDKFHVLAADLVGFGQSGRRLAEPYFDMDMWVRQAELLVESLPAGPVGAIGHSLSGGIVLKLAARNRRVAGVLTTGTMGASFTVKQGTRGWTFPETREQLRLSAEGTVYTKSLIDDAELDYRQRVLTAPGYRDYFTKMFSRDRQFYMDLGALSDDELKRIECPVLLMHGAQDASIAAADTSLALARAIPQADVMILGGCGHSVALEFPDKFLAEVSRFFKG
jgi:2-hydroxymuconate-semialdehyde hydrolase